MSRPDSLAPDAANDPVAADLFNWNSRYPNQAGFQATDTSAAAATEIEDSGRAAILREAVLRLLRGGEAMTADECATRLEESVLSIRPRFTELRQKFLIKDSGLRRPNTSGRNAIVWVRA